MELTDNQYNLLSRYVDGDLSITERELFELSLNTNEILKKELMFYNEVKSLSASIEEKISKAAYSLYDNNAEPGKIPLVTQARKNWERDYEDELKLKLGIESSSKPGTKISSSLSKLRSINTWKWVAAAVFLGFISLGAMWWNAHYKNDASIVAGNRQDKNASSEINGSDSIRDPDISKDNLSSTSPKEDNINIGESKEDNNRLFNDFFTPDKTPEIIEGPLETAFTYYLKKMYRLSHKAFKTADFGPVTRGDDENQQKLKFYVHYYSGLSFMADETNNVSAIKEMKLAVSKSPDKTWEERANWYLALAHLKNGDEDEATNVLKQVAGSSRKSQFKIQADTLLKELEVIRNKK